jgi:hypothetical protein
VGVWDSEPWDSEPWDSEAWDSERSEPLVSRKLDSEPWGWGWAPHDSDSSHSTIPALPGQESQDPLHGATVLLDRLPLESMGKESMLTQLRKSARWTHGVPPKTKTYFVPVRPEETQLPHFYFDGGDRVYIIPLDEPDEDGSGGTPELAQPEDEPPAHDMSTQRQSTLLTVERMITDNLGVGRAGSGTVNRPLKRTSTVITWEW